jgi:hypothetical protein
MRNVELRYASMAAFEADMGTNLSKSRAFVTGEAPMGERERCALVVVHPANESTFVCDAEAVWNGPSGVGLALVGMTPERKEQLRSFAAGALAPPPSEAATLPELEAAAPAEGTPTETEGQAAEGEEGEDVDPTVGDTPAARQARNIHEKVRHLSTREREEMARRGQMAERVALERAFGGVVWEGLLQNPQITPAEVARIAKNGALPKPLVGIIVGSSAWLASGEVQRALLSNPRCTGPHLERVMRSMKQMDLARLAQHCPYRQEVRSTAQRLTAKK